MSGGRFFVNLREVSTLEKILACQSLLKVVDNYYYWMQDEHTGWGTMLTHAFYSKIRVR